MLQLDPFDKDALVSSAKKTKRIVIVHEAVRTSGFGAEIGATLAEEAFDYLDAPIKQVTAPDTPVPFAPNLEEAFLPNEDKIISAVKSLF